MRAQQPQKPGQTNQEGQACALARIINMIEQLTDLGRYSQIVDSTRELEGLKLIRIPIGTFGGTQERVFVVKDGHIHAFDTGDQGGGQS